MNVLAFAPPQKGHRHVLEFDCGVRAYPPASRGGYWRLRWGEGERRRETTASSHEEAVSKAGDLVARLSQGRPTDLAQAHGDALVRHYLDPDRRPARRRGRLWSPRHREEEQAYCDRFIKPVIDHVELGRLTRLHFAEIMAKAPTASVAAHLRRSLSAMVGAGLEEGLLLARQDVLRGVCWAPPAGAERDDDEDSGRFVEGPRSPPPGPCTRWRRGGGALRVWWRELQPLFVAYSGLRWGEMAALTADRVDPALWRVIVDRQLVETRHELALTLSKNRRRRKTHVPGPHPRRPRPSRPRRPAPGRDRSRGSAVPLPEGLSAPAFELPAQHLRPAAALAAGWPRSNGRWVWTFHSLRHVFATWALAQPGARIEDVSKLMGHSNVRITQDLYISPDGDLFDRFFRATE